MAKSPFRQRIDDKVEPYPFGENLRGSARRSHRRQTVPRQAHHRPGQPLIERARGEGRHAGDFHASVERLVIDLEALIVGAVARLMDVVDRYHQTGAVLVAAYAARGLDVLRARFRLPENHHQAQPRNVEAHRDHIGSDRDMYSFVLPKRQRQATLGLRHPRRALAAGQFDRFVIDLAVGEQPFRLTYAASLTSSPPIDCALRLR